MLGDPECVAGAGDRTGPGRLVPGAARRGGRLAAGGRVWHRLARFGLHMASLCRLVALLWPLARPRAAWINGCWRGLCHECHSRLPKMAWINGFPGPGPAGQGFALCSATPDAWRHRLTRRGLAGWCPWRRAEAAAWRLVAPLGPFRHPHGTLLAPLWPLDGSPGSRAPQRVYRAFGGNSLWGPLGGGLPCVRRPPALVSERDVESWSFEMPPLTLGEDNGKHKLGGP